MRLSIPSRPGRGFWGVSEKPFPEVSHALQCLNGVNHRPDMWGGHETRTVAPPFLNPPGLEPGANDVPAHKTPIRAFFFRLPMGW